MKTKKGTRKAKVVRAKKAPAARKRASRRRRNPVELPVIALNPGPRKRKKRKATETMAKRKRPRKRKNPGRARRGVSALKPHRSKRRRRNPSGGGGGGVKPILFAVAGGLGAVAAGVMIGRANLSNQMQKLAVLVGGGGIALALRKRAPAVAGGVAAGTASLLGVQLLLEQGAGASAGAGATRAGQLASPTSRLSQIRTPVQFGSRTSNLSSRFSGIDEEDHALGALVATLGDVDDDEQIGAIEAAGMQLGDVDDDDLSAVEAQLGDVDDDYE